MTYSFEKMKALFDQYHIQKLENGKYIIVDRKTKAVWNENDDPVLVDGVKFGYTWFNATEYGRSRTNPDARIVTADDYEYAFNEDAKKLYDKIMEIVSPVMQSTGHLLRCEPLIQEIKQVKGLRTGSELTVQGLYQNDRFIQSFFNWTRRANNMPVYMDSNKEPTKQK